MGAALLIALLASTALRSPFLAKFNSKLDAETDASLAPVVCRDVEQRREQREKQRPNQPELKQGQSPVNSNQLQSASRRDRKNAKKITRSSVAEQIDFATEAALQPALVNEDDSTNDEVRTSQRAAFLQKTSGPERAANWLIRKYDELNS